MAVILLCHFDGTNGSTTFTDASASAHTLTPTSTTVSTTSPKFGTGVGDFTASAAARIDTGTTVDFRPAAGQFTVEAWAYYTSAPSSVQGIVSQWGSTNRGWFLGTDIPGTSGVALYYSTTGADAPNIHAAFSPTLNTWYHIAADRDAANVMRLYVNGAVVASATVATTIFASTRNCLIGNTGDLTQGFPGRLDEARVNIGTAMYGGAFPLPIAPFTTPPTTYECATQIAIEHWASVAAATPGGPQTIGAMVLA